MMIVLASTPRNQEPEDVCSNCGGKLSELDKELGRCPHCGAPQ